MQGTVVLIWMDPSDPTSTRRTHVVRTETRRSICECDGASLLYGTSINDVFESTLPKHEMQKRRCAIGGDWACTYAVPYDSEYVELPTGTSRWLDALFASASIRNEAWRSEFARCTGATRVSIEDEFETLFRDNVEMRFTYPQPTPFVGYVCFTLALEHTDRRTGDSRAVPLDSEVILELMRDRDKTGVRRVVRECVKLAGEQCIWASLLRKHLANGSIDID